MVFPALPLVSNLLDTALPVVAWVVTVKCVKYTIVYWRVTTVNGEVQKLVMSKRTDPPGRIVDTPAIGSEAASGSQEASGSAVSAWPAPPAIVAADRDSVCGCCSGSLCLDGVAEVLQASDAEGEVEQVVLDEDHCVVLDRCGCVLHLSCLLQSIKQEQGMSFPKVPTRLDDIDNTFLHIFKMLGRMLNVVSVDVDVLKCPICGTENESWRPYGQSMCGVKVQRRLLLAPEEAEATTADADVLAKHAEFIWG